MKPADLRELTEDELLQKEREFKRRLFNLRFQLATNQQENTAALRKARQDVARVRTVLRERELGVER